MFRFLIINLAVTSVTLGALKYKGAIAVKPESIKNEYLVGAQRPVRVD